MLEAVRGSMYTIRLSRSIVDLVSFAFAVCPRRFIVTQHHLVSDAPREQWEAYSLPSSAWVDNGLKLQKDDPNYLGICMSDYEPVGPIY